MSESLETRAMRVYPDDAIFGIDRSRLREQWAAAVRAVRKTKRGWVGDARPRPSAVPLQEKTA